MPLGVENGELTESPGGYSGVKELAKGPVRWVYSVTGEAVVVMDGPDGYPVFATSSESSRPRDVGRQHSPGAEPLHVA